MRYYRVTAVATRTYWWERFVEAESEEQARKEVVREIQTNIQLDLDAEEECEPQEGFGNSNSQTSYDIIGVVDETEEDTDEN